MLTTGHALDLFPRAKPVVAVLHVGPLPGAPGAVGVRSTVDRAVAEARVLFELGVDGVLLEAEPPVPGEAGPEAVAALTRLAVAVLRSVGRLPVGVRVVGADRAALAVAYGAGCHFVRVDGQAGGAPAADRFHRYRARIGAERVPVLADVRPRDAAEAEALAAAADLAQADAVAVLGPARGRPPAPGAVEAARRATALPLFCGGGLGPENLPDYLDGADGFLVGCGLKEQRRRRAPLCEPRVRRLVGALEYARGQEVRQ